MQTLAATALAALSLALAGPAAAQVQAPPATATPSQPAPAPKSQAKPAPPKRAKPHAGKPSRPKLHGNTARADAAYAAMQRQFYLAGTGLYRGSPYSYLWGFSEALAATIAVSRVPMLEHPYHHELHVRMQGLAAYWDPAPPAGYDGAVAPPTGPGGPKYYDDNDWVALQLLDLYAAHPQPWLLTRARELFTLISDAWDGDPGHPCPGGVPFSSAPTNTDRNTVTNAPTAELAIRLYRLTRDRSYLSWARRMYEWVRTCLPSTTSGLYADHLRYDGTVDQTLWSYDQGTMIGAAALLYQATGDSKYLAQARATAAAATAYFDQQRLQAEPRFFVAVYFRNLLLLDGVRHDPAYRAAASAYAGWAWNSVRQRATGLFVFDPSSFQLLDQASLVEIYALLAAPPRSGL